MAWWKSLISPVTGIVGDWLQGRHEIRMAELKAKISKIESSARIEEAKAAAIVHMAASAQEHEQNWERILVSQSSNDWKDEFWTIIVSIPLVLAFIPGLAHYVGMGFDNLENVPDWYLTVVGAAVSFAFARRGLLSVMSNARGRNNGVRQDD